MKKLEEYTSCLKELGFTEKEIEIFKNMYISNDWQGQLKLLNAFRKKRLDELHTAQKKIECVDYLIAHLRDEA